MSMADVYWERFLKESGRSPDERYSGEMSFENRSITGDEQLALVLAGRKTAVFTPFPSYAINREPVPVAGEVYIVEDRNDEPRCIIETVSVSVIPFDEITWQLAQCDGESESLESWREKEQDYFHEEGDICGFVFDAKTRIVCERFSLLWRS